MAVILLGIVTAGVIISGIMVGVTLKRWHSFIPKYDPSDRLGEIKVKIAYLTMLRALRMEIVFLLCQTARFVHTIYVIFYMREQVDWPAALERSFVTIMLIHLSVTDLITRSRIARKIDILHPEPKLPTVL